MNPMDFNPSRRVRLGAAGVASAGIIVLTYFDVMQLLLMPVLLFSLWMPLLLPTKQTPTQKFLRFALIAMLTALLLAGTVALYLQHR